MSTTNINCAPNDAVYRVGDSYTFSSMPCFGWITTSGTDAMIHFIPVKLLTQVSGFTVSSLTVALRGFSGTTAKYVGDSSSYNPISDSTVSLANALDHGTCRIRLRKTSSFGLTNNTPLFGVITGTIKFT